MQNLDTSIDMSFEDLSAEYRRLTEMQDLVTSLLANLFHCPTDEVDKTIDASLARLGAFVSADRAYIFELQPGDLLSNTYEWCAQGIEPAIDTLQNIPQNVIHFWLAPLANGEPVYVPEVMALPDERAAEREVLAKQDIQSLLVVPMLNAGQLFGFVGFDSVRAHRTFASGEVSLLRSVAALTCATLLRRQIAQQVTRAEAELRLHEERFRIIADAVSDVLWDHDFEKQTWWMSRDWPEKLGLSVRASQDDPRNWFERVHPDDKAKFQSSFSEMLRSSNGSWEVDYRIVGDGNESIDVLVNAAVFRFPDGRVSRMLGNVRNITQEKRNQDGYTRARALEAVGQLTGGVAHDFNNLLMIILGNAELLEMSNLSEDDTEAVSMISQAAESAATLTRQLLTFARQSQLKTTRVDVTALISDTITLLRSGLPESVSLSQTIAPDVWAVNADANGLQQAIINLAINSHSAMPRGGEIELTCSNLEVGEDMIALAADLKPGRYVALSLSDTGEGMSPEVLSKAFEPFFTTKEVGKGAGLGMSTVYGYVKQSGGGTSISSELGRGTTVTLYLPACDDTTSPQKDDEPEYRPAWDASHKRILVVEDEPQVRAHVEKTLARFGYEVASAPDAASALNMFQRGEAFDLLFSDIVMPGGMNGHELGEAALKICPQLKILYTSGYPAAAFEHLGNEEQSRINFLGKPYKAQEIRDKLAEILGE